jgi:hypothetical protein
MMNFVQVGGKYKGTERESQRVGGKRKREKPPKFTVELNYRSRGRYELDMEAHSAYNV